MFHSKNTTGRNGFCIGERLVRNHFSLNVLNVARSLRDDCQIIEI